MSDGAAKLGLGILVSLQLILLVLGGFVVVDAKADGAWGWDAPASVRAEEGADGGNNTSVAMPSLFPLFGFDVGHTDGALVLVAAQVLLMVGAVAMWPRAPWEEDDPRAVRRAAEQREAKLRELKERLMETQGVLDATQARLEAERAEHQRILNGIPPGIVHYYRDGAHRQNGNGSILRDATRERRAWDALSHTLHTGAVAPLLAALAAVPEDHAAGTHHYSTEEVVALLVRISSELRENDWMSKALRWAEAKYGSS